MRSQHRATLALALAAVATSLDVRPAPLKPVERRTFLGASAAALAAPRAAVAGSDGVRPAPAAIPVATKLFDLEVPFKGKPQPLSKFRGSAHLVVNIKMDDPVAGENFNALRYVAANYAERGLRVWAFPTEQGYYEPDVSELVRAKAYSQFGFGTYPTAVVFDKIDVIGNTAHPLYRYLALATNPNGVGRLTVNFEKFLLDGDGKPLRRYPRKFTARGAARRDG
jgi:glutathione peroxidase